MPKIVSSLMLQLVASTAIAAMMVGCTGGGTAATVPVKGIVKFNGAAVPNAAVTFAPATAGGTVATGMTNGQGEFVLQTFVAGDGAVPGDYKVVISKSQVTPTVSAAGKSTADDPSAAYAAAEAAGANVGGKENYTPPAGTAAAAASAGPQDLLPPKYKSVETTDLTAKVEKGKDNNFTFDLK